MQHVVNSYWAKTSVNHAAMARKSEGYKKEVRIYNANIKKEMREVTRNEFELQNTTGILGCFKQNTEFGYFSLCQKKKRIRIFQSLSKGYMSNIILEYPLE